MAVAARNPGPSDARIPCPLCGGLIHPIAGRCKHCKADIAALGAKRPAAMAALPPLAAPGMAPLQQVQIDPPPAIIGNGNGHGAYTPNLAATVVAPPSPVVAMA